MNKLLFVLLLVSTQSFSQVTLTESNLPIVLITTLPGDTIRDDPRIVCHMGIIDNGTGIINNITDPLNDYDGNISIEIRGSTSQQYPKKSYGLETQTDLGENNNVSILGMPVENDWILYGPFPDKTCIRNMLTFYLSRAMGNYAPRAVYCELVINDDYRGLYMMMEKIKRDDDRVDIATLNDGDISGVDITGGYVIKVDKTTGSIADTWPSDYNEEVLFQYHDPAPDELLLVQKTYIQSVVSQFEDAIWGDDFADPELGYHALIDKVTFYDFFILQELGRTVDGYRSSSFLHKDRDDVWGGLLRAGPMWDFNLSYGNADYCDAETITGWQYEFDEVCGPWFSSSIPFWWEKMLEDDDYSDGLQCRWSTLREGPLHTDSINNFIDSVAIYIEEGRIRNFERWEIIGVYVNWNGFVGDTYEEDLNFLKSYIEQRSIWMDANVPGTCWPGLADQEAIEPPEKMSRAWPNPFAEFLFIGYTVRTAGDTRIQIHNINGQLVQEFNQGYLAPGNYIKKWEGITVPSGTYVYSIYVNDELLDRNKIVR
ncbi:MAG: hypothetical protein ACI8ZM_001196 [Crocinitomix sp.]|jgi:hypothetical protein